VNNLRNRDISDIAISLREGNGHLTLMRRMMKLIRHCWSGIKFLFSPLRRNYSANSRDVGMSLYSFCRGYRFQRLFERDLRVLEEMQEGVQGM
jgi:hypothetical protein